jgi:hypothetical protein
MRIDWTTRLGALALAAALAAVACSGSGATGATGDGAAGGDVADVRPEVDAPAELPFCIACDVFAEEAPDAAIDEREGGDDEDEGTQDAETDEGPSGCPGAPGCSCKSNAECLTGYCIETLDGFVCATLCQTDEPCPKGWLCGQLGTGTDMMFGCISPTRLCRPCRQDSDCEQARPGRSACVPYGPEGSFCGIECDGDELQCPEGYECKAVTLSTESVSQCLPVSGTCPCTQKYKDGGFLTTCYVETRGIGKCEATRTCDVPCPAPAPKAEECNLKDEDCDGAIDNDVQSHDCPVTGSPYGTCTGKTKCVGGTELCEGTLASQEMCNGINDDCDAETDEEGAVGCKTYLRDADGDKVGKDGDEKCLCVPAAPYNATKGGDCDDDAASIHPGATETCNGHDDDCDGAVDEDTDAECFPTVCDPAAGGCTSSCSGPEDCQSGYECADGKCRKTIGQPCAADGECATKSCADGVCCESACDGVCERCNVALHAGSCLAVPDGDDPDQECLDGAGPESCGLTGVCSGQRSCAAYPVGTTCAAPSCETSATSHRASTCAGLGICHDNGLEDCAPYTCDAGSGLCRKACGSDADCGGGFSCAADGFCKVATGKSCLVDAECASGFCADGFCCESRCDGLCERCSYAGAEGTCAAVPPGQDPDDECDAGPESVCGQTGACSGKRSCELWPEGTICVPPSCQDAGTALPADACDGAGHCVDNGTAACAPYVCSDATGACLSACSGDAECQAGFQCWGGACLKVQGAPCGEDAECAHAFCADGVCCESRCGDLCERCDGPDRAGFCDPVPAGEDPAVECEAQVPPVCGQTGACSGFRSCALLTSGTVCVAHACSDLYHLAIDDTCDGKGVCQDGGLLDCLPYTCDIAAKACKSACGTGADCQGGYTCVKGTCKLAIGEPCQSGIQCGTGFCEDGVCCESACSGVCERCDGPGREGRCDAIEGGFDPQEECATTAADTCATTGVCSGTRSCRLWANGTECQPRSCKSATSSWRPWACNGLGSCLDTGFDDCSPYVCDPATGACRTSCALDGDCVAGRVCAGGVCLKDLGQACIAGSECAAGFCADGVCCESACAGTCERCNLAGHAGICDPVPKDQDPDNECDVSQAWTCGTTGVCSGQRSCALWANGTVCVAQACKNLYVMNLDDKCNGWGSCADGGMKDCTPYTCDVAGSACRTTCSGDADCQTGFACAGGTCRKATGQSCGIDADCATGFCTDQTCCESRCNGVCEQCNASGQAGKCNAIPEGNDPASECQDQGASSCGTSGACSGSRTCSLYGAGVVCVAAKCAAGGTQSELADTCNGSGTCVDKGIEDCTPNTCDAATGLCRAQCSSPGQCATGYTCVSGTCKKVAGQTCSTDAECASGFCTDNVCCELRCNGKCEKCSLPGRLGFCDPVPQDADPDSECPNDLASTCQYTGNCSGQRSCSYWPSGTVCQAKQCLSQNVLELAHSCSGGGSCQDGGTQDCLPYVCNYATAACKTSCSVKADCQAGYTCAGGVCKKDLGEDCSAGAQCATGFCTDGVCCESACGGTCEKCSQAGRRGYCDPIAGGSDPDAECADGLPASSCGTTGVCSGSRSCTLYPSGTVCVAAVCAGSISNLADTCDGAGKCNDGGTLNCFPYVCNASSGLCKTSCAIDADCQTGYGCISSECKKVIGQPCALNTECKTNYCRDQVCCDAACSGTCEKCNLSGSIGYCSAIAAGTDPDNECVESSATSCGLDGYCSGARSCRLWASGTVCAAAYCYNSTTLYKTDTCNGLGACSDGGQQVCTPFACVSGACKASCTSGSDCAPGYGCKTATGQCLKEDGQSCGGNGECLNGACCSNVCRNLSADTNNCGACGKVCGLTHASGTSCASGTCSPSCSSGWSVCSGNPADGCLTSLKTLTDCGGCGVGCDMPNGTESCDTGTCTVTGCSSGYANCDTAINPNGCEVNLGAYANSCGSATNAGSACGDDSCEIIPPFVCSGASWNGSPFATQTGRGSKWFRAHASVCEYWCCTTILAKARLTVPTGANYDLFVYHACGTLPDLSGTGGTGVTEELSFGNSDACYNDTGFDYWIEVRWVGGSSCDSWKLELFGTIC